MMALLPMILFILYYNHSDLASHCYNNNIACDDAINIDVHLNSRYNSRMTGQI